MQVAGLAEWATAALQLICRDAIGHCHMPPLWGGGMPWHAGWVVGERPIRAPAPVSLYCPEGTRRTFSGPSGRAPSAPRTSSGSADEAGVGPIELGTELGQGLAHLGVRTSVNFYAGNVGNRRHPFREGTKRLKTFVPRGRKRIRDPSATSALDDATRGRSDNPNLSGRLGTLLA